MRWRLLLTPPVEVSLPALPPQTKRYVRQALDEICRDPWVGKPLRDELAGFHSFRVNRFRIIYQIRSQDRRLMVIGVGRRETIYQEITAVLGHVRAGDKFSREEMNAR